ncbi:CIMIP2 protein CG18335 [Bacillus rossius redtenbacheri]|uniref:CIMIP2 protein CG18335 n=1 Tax=Bacillus rossius redtenbacheri TaxID=93214 RepID=UPI002FDDECF4
MTELNKQATSGTHSAAGAVTHLCSRQSRYTGFVPQLKYRQGHTFGSLTHKILVDPAVSKSEKLIVSDRSADEYQVLRPPPGDIALVEGRLLCGDVIYRHPAVPGYEGFVPQLRSHLGQRFSVAATEALAGFQKQQLKDRQALNLLRHHASLQEGRHQPRRLGDRQMLQTQFRMPLSVVRPEMAGVVRKVPVTEPYLAPPSHSSSPYFLHVGHPDKHFMSGSRAGCQIPVRPDLRQRHRGWFAVAARGLLLRLCCHLQRRHESSRSTILSTVTPRRISLCISFGVTHLAPSANMVEVRKYTITLAIKRNCITNWSKYISLLQPVFNKLIIFCFLSFCV